MVFFESVFGSGRGFAGKKNRRRNSEGLRKKEKDFQRGNPASPFDGGKIFLGYSRPFREFPLGVSPLYPKMPDAGTMKTIHVSLLVRQDVFRKEFSEFFQWGRRRNAISKANFTYGVKYKCLSVDPTSALCYQTPALPKRHINAKLCNHRAWRFFIVHSFGFSK